MLTPWIVIIAIVWSGFILWTIRKFWRKAPNRGNEQYFAQGKIWGTLFCICFALILPAETSFPGLPYWLEVLFLGFIGFPIATIGGHVYGRCIQALMEGRQDK